MNRRAWVGTGFYIAAVWALGIALMATAPFQHRGVTIVACILVMLFYPGYSLITVERIRIWFASLTLLLGMLWHGYVMFDVVLTFDPTKVIIQFFLCVIPFQILAWNGVLSERFWKSTDYVWILVGTLALFGSGLHKIRSELVREPGAYERAMVAERAHVLKVIDQAIAHAYMEPLPIVTERHTETITPEMRKKWKEEDTRYRDWLTEVRNQLTAKGADWTAAELQQLLASEPPHSGRIHRPFKVQAKGLADHFQTQENRKEWYDGANKMTRLEQTWLDLSPLGLLFAIGLRLGKTSAEVRKLSIRPES